MKTFQNKVSVVTGAGSGMGRYLALNLAQEGSDVVICDINQKALNETKDLIKAYKGNGYPCCKPWQNNLL